MNEEARIAVDLLADSIVEAVALDEENGSHYVELKRFENDFPKDQKGRNEFLKTLLAGVKRRIKNADIDIFIDQNGEEVMMIDEGS